MNVENENRPIREKIRAESMALTVLNSPIQHKYATVPTEQDNIVRDIGAIKYCTYCDSFSLMDRNGHGQMLNTYFR